MRFTYVYFTRDKLYLTFCVCLLVTIVEAVMICRDSSTREFMNDILGTKKGDLV